MKLFAQCNFACILTRYIIVTGTYSCLWAYSYGVKIFFLFFLFLQRVSSPLHSYGKQKWIEILVGKESSSYTYQPTSMHR